MEIEKTAVAGTLESGDIMVTVERREQGIEIELDSIVEKQFGREIRRVIAETLDGLGIQNAHVQAVDKGALNCIIQARVQTAAWRAGGKGAAFDWDRG